MGGTVAQLNEARPKAKSVDLTCRCSSCVQDYIDFTLSMQMLNHGVSKIVDFLDHIKVSGL
jgi:hypothetical protein